MQITEIKAEQLYTSEEVTEYLRVSLRTSQRLLKSGVLPSYKVHGQYRIKGIDILNYLNDIRKDYSLPEEYSESKPADLIRLLEVHPISLELGINLLSLVDQNQGGRILNEINKLREDIIKELGFIFPGIQFRDSLNLQPNEYQILINDLPVFKTIIYPDKIYACTSEEQLKNVYKPLKEELPGKKGYWISDSQQEEFLNKGYTIIKPDSLILEQMSKIIKKYAHEIISREEVFTIIERIRKRHSVVVEEVISEENSPDKLNIGQLRKILKELLKENVSIRNIPLILEVLADNLSEGKDINKLLSKLREGLSGQICLSLSESNKSLNIVSMEKELENLIIKTFKEKGESVSDFDPSIREKIFTQLNKLPEKSIIICSSVIRKYFKNIISRSYPDITVLSYTEIHSDFKISEKFRLKF